MPGEARLKTLVEHVAQLRAVEELHRDDHVLVVRPQETRPGHGQLLQDLGLAARARAAQPEVVLLFASMHYDHADLLSGLYDGLDNDNLRVIGNTGDGCYGPHGNEDIGASALGLMIGSFGIARPG